MKDTILKTELGAKVFITILTNKENGISGYEIAKHIYRRKIPPSARVYQTLELLKKEKLVKTVLFKKGKKVIKLNKPDFDELRKLMNFDEKEMNVFKQLPFRNLKNLTYFDLIILLIKNILKTRGVRV